MLFVAGMSVRNNLHLGTFMTIFALLSILALLGVLALRESPMIRQNQ
jgi:hypothetical protein